MDLDILSLLIGLFDLEDRGPGHIKALGNIHGTVTSQDTLENFPPQLRHFAVAKPNWPDMPAF